MIKIANAQFWVHDQDAALAFYTKTLGWEVRADVTMEAWHFRWLAVGPVGQDNVGLVLMPVWGALLGVVIKLRDWGPAPLLGAVALLVVLDVCLTIVAAATWRREEVLSHS